MTTTTPNLSLVLYNSTTDQAEYFSNFRATIAGTSGTSNFYKIDTAYGVQAGQITALQTTRGAIYVPATFVSSNYYESSGITEITSYITNMTIIVKLDVASAGTVTLNINSLGTKSLYKINSAGTGVNISAGELMVGKNYLFRYDGTQWVWVSSNSADQVYIAGTSGNLVTVNSDNTLLGTTAMIVKASGAELDTGTDDVKFATAKALKDSHNVPSVAPSTSGNILTSNGTDWTSSAPTFLVTTNNLSDISSASTARTNLGLVINTDVIGYATGTITSSATPTPTGSSLRTFYTITALGEGATFGIPSGSPVDGNMLNIRIKDDGTARTLAFNAIYRAVGTALPATTVLGKTLYILFFYNSADSKWDLVSLAQEA